MTSCLCAVPLSPLSSKSTIGAAQQTARIMVAGDPVGFRTVAYCKLLVELPALSHLPLTKGPHTSPRICRMPSSRLVEAMIDSQTLFRREFLGKGACHYACHAEIRTFRPEKYPDAMEPCSLSLTPASEPTHPFGMRQVLLEYERAAAMDVASWLSRRSWGPPSRLTLDLQVPVGCTRSECRRQGDAGQIGLMITLRLTVMRRQGPDELTRGTSVQPSLSILSLATLRPIEARPGQMLGKCLKSTTRRRWHFDRRL